MQEQKLFDKNVFEPSVLLKIIKHDDFSFAELFIHSYKKLSIRGKDGFSYMRDFQFLQWFDSENFIKKKLLRKACSKDNLKPSSYNEELEPSLKNNE